MDATLTLVSNVLAYADPSATSNPKKRHVDWTSSRSYVVENAQELPLEVAPGDTLVLFSGVKSTSISNTTEFNLALSSLASTRYRFTWSGTGANPAFRTDRALTLNGASLAFVANSNQTVTVTGPVAAFTGVVAGDVVFIPGIATGDTAGPNDPINVGYWTVLTASTTVLQLSRPAGTTFAGLTETVVLTANIQFQAFSSAGIQVGDSVTISAGFSTTVQKTFRVEAVNPKWFEVISTSPMPVAETAVPTTSGIQFYSSAKRYLKLMVDQEATLRLNGDTGNTNRISPWLAGDPEDMGTFEKVGPVWSASVVNLSTETMNLLLITAE